MSESICYDPDAAFACYPDTAQVDAWCESLLYKSAKLPADGTFTEDMPVRHSFGNGPNALINRYVRFVMPDHVFYGYWQPAMKQPAPLLVNLPGYGGYISMHPQIHDDGYHILHISPLGYITPEGPREELMMEDGNWPVLDLTARGCPGGYEDWLLDALAAIRWAQQQPGVLSERLSLFGTSQGGGGSLLLASLLQDQVRCVCADLPFLTAFPLSHLAGDAYGILQKAYAEVPAEQFWNRLGYADTLSHAHRLRLPVMLSAGGADTVCTAASVEALFQKLPGTRQYTFLQENVHTHSRESMYLFRSWLALHA